jgi:hypothetical protein
MDKLVNLYNADNKQFYQLLSVNIKHMTDDKLENYVDRLSVLIYKNKFNEGKTGTIYCLYNNVYQFYGDYVYKLGCTNDIDKRLCTYTTNYIDKCEVKHKSKILKNCELAESILFYILRKHRIVENREFFNI